VFGTRQPRKGAKDTKVAPFVSFAHFASFAFQAPARPTIRFIPPIRALPRPRQVQRQQPRQHLHIRQILRPAVGGEHGRIQPAMRGGQPRRTGVAEVAERALCFSLDLTLCAILAVSVLGRLPRATQEKSGGTSRQHRCKRRMAESTYPSPIFFASKNCHDLHQRDFSIRFPQSSVRRTRQSIRRAARNVLHA
jgi:hypothetical protein